jgi:hypothetical protein
VSFRQALFIRHRQKFGRSAMLVWVGHSCPTLLTLLLILLLLPPLMLGLRVWIGPGRS